MAPKTAIPTTTTEPSRKVGAITGVITAVFILLAALGLGVDPSVHEAIIGLVLALSVAIPMIQAEITRAKVFSLASVREINRRAYQAGKNGEPMPDISLGAVIEAVIEDDESAS